jgi:hypothetical protein
VKGRANWVSGPNAESNQTLGPCLACLGVASPLNPKNPNIQNVAQESEPKIRYHRGKRFAVRTFSQEESGRCSRSSRLPR